MKSLEDCEKLSSEVFQVAKSNPIILLNGDMGAGKTQWTKFYLKNFDYTEVESPTFSLHNAYETSSGTVHHFDLHRIEDDEELDQVGLWEILNGPETVIIEWSGRIQEKDLPHDKAVVKIDIDGSRNVEINYYAAEE